MNISATKGFNVEKVTRECIEWIRKWFDENGHDSPAIIGISGGKDSSVVATLCAKALGKDRVIGVKIPKGIQSDISDSNAIIEWLGIKSVEINISYMDSLYSQIETNNYHLNGTVVTNAPARERMNVLYTVSQCVNGRVANTCNLSEDYIGWSTKWGDSTGDFAPINMLTASEVVEMGKYLGIPSFLIEKAPSDGMCGQTDEEKLGFSYNYLDNYIRERYGYYMKNDKAEMKILIMHNNPNTKKKLYGIDNFEPSKFDLTEN